MNKYFAASLIILSIISTTFVSAQEDVPPYNPNTTGCITLQNNLIYRSRDTNTNGEVSTLQDFLQSQSYLNTEPTGYFGLLTLQAVKSFQNSNGIVGNGYVGPITRAKINSVSCGTNSGNNGNGTTFNIIYPRGGETLTPGQTYNIQWSANDGNYINTSYLIYLYQNGNFYRNIGTGIRSNNQTIYNFSWTVPYDIIPGTYTIRIGQSLSGISNAFYIGNSGNQGNGNGSGTYTPSISLVSSPQATGGSLSIPLGNTFLVNAQTQNAAGYSADFHVDGIFSCNLINDNWSISCVATRRGTGTIYVDLVDVGTYRSNSIKVTVF